MISLSKKIIDKIDQLDNNDPYWVMFVKDYYHQIRNINSIKIAVDPNVMNKFKYRPRDFMRDADYPASITWIMLFINGLEDTTKFVGLNELYLPTIEYINTLQTRYESTKATS